MGESVCTYKCDVLTSAFSVWMRCAAHDFHLLGIALENLAGLSSSSTERNELLNRALSKYSEAAKACAVIDGEAWVYMER